MFWLANQPKSRCPNNLAHIAELVAFLGHVSIANQSLQTNCNALCEKMVKIRCVAHTWLSCRKLGVKLNGANSGHFSRPLFWRNRRSLLLSRYHQALPSQLA